MVVQDKYENSDMPDEVAIVKTTKNNIIDDAASTRKEKSPELSTYFSQSMERTQKRKKKSVKKFNLASAVNSEEYDPSNTVISKDDLLELRTVYDKCKSVIKKIETKYGHLLELDSVDTLTTDYPGKKRRKEAEGTNEQENNEKCQCTLNKKIVFDEEGKEVTTETQPSTHICPNKLMLQKYDEHVLKNLENNIQIEYHSNDVELPDNLQELQHILQNPDIETIYRNQVINKLKLIKQEHLNEIRFIKHSLVEKSKFNPDEILCFNGANLSSLIGYPY